MFANNLVGIYFYEFEIHKASVCLIMCIIEYRGTFQKVFLSYFFVFRLFSRSHQKIHDIYNCCRIFKNSSIIICLTICFCCIWDLNLNFLMRDQCFFKIEIEAAFSYIKKTWEFKDNEGDVMSFLVLFWRLMHVLLITSIRTNTNITISRYRKGTFSLNNFLTSLL